MSVNHTYTFGWKTSGGASLSRPVTVTDQAESNLDIVVATGVTNQLATLAIDITKTSGLFLVSNADVTVKTNSTGSPANTFALLAGIPLVWHSGSYYTIPFGTSVTSLYVTNASGQQATVQLRLLYHP